MSRPKVTESAPADPASPVGDPHAPYVRLAVVGLVCRSHELGRAGTADAVGGSAAARRPGVADMRWLLLHRTQPFQAWDPPGGRMEAGEDLVIAVTREVLEETGLAVEVGGPCYAFLTFYKGERLLAVSMACRPVGDADDVRLEPGGSEGWRWATAGEWEGLATQGLSSWDAWDVRKAVTMAAALWEA